MNSLTTGGVRSKAAETRAADHEHVYDSVTLSRIVEIRDALIDKQNRGEKVYRMESGTPSYPIFPEVAEAMIRAIRDNKTYYTEATGIRPLRAKICEKLARKNGIVHDLSEETVFTGQGAMGVLYCVLTSVLGRDETVLLPSPVWESMIHVARLSGARLVDVPTHEELGFNWRMDEFAAAVETHRPRAVIIVNPGNPTGGIFPKGDVAPLFELVRRHRFFVIEDLAYEDLVYDPDYVILTQQAHATNDPEIYRRFIPIFSMSKSQNFSGLRIGYTHLIDPQMIERYRKALLYTTNGVNSVAQWGAVEALDARHDGRLREMAAGYKARGDALQDGLVQAGVFNFTLKPKGAFYWYPHINREALIEQARGRFTVPPASDPLPLGEWMSQHILRHGIGSVAGHHFGACTSDYIRFAYTCSLEDCREAGQRLAELFG
jgi:aspartate aminotransferase